MSGYFLPHIDRMAGYVPGEQPRMADLVKLNTAVSGNSGVDPDEAARDWLGDNGFDKPIGK